MVFFCVCAKHKCVIFSRRSVMRKSFCNVSFFFFFVLSLFSLSFFTSEENSVFFVRFHILFYRFFFAYTLFFPTKFQFVFYYYGIENARTHMSEEKKESKNCINVCRSHELTSIECMWTNYFDTWWCNKENRITSLYFLYNQKDKKNSFEDHIDLNFFLLRFIYRIILIQTFIFSYVVNLENIVNYHFWLYFSVSKWFVCCQSTYNISLCLLLLPVTTFLIF